MDFYDQSSHFIDGLKVPPTDKVDLKNNLTAYLRSNQPTISVRSFANDFLKPIFQTHYVKFMHKGGFQARDYPKDTTLIAAKLRHRKITFSSKVKIVGPSDVFAESVQVIGKEGAWTTVKIAGEITEQ